MGNEPNQWAESLHEVQRLLNNSETKVTSKTPCEMLHGYRPRFRQSILRELSKTVDNWEPPEKLRAVIRRQMEREKERRKAGYDEHRHDNLKYSVGEVVVMRRAPNSTGESTKLDDSKSSRFATTTHVSQLKCWKMVDEEDQASENTEL
jgi:hypothetical protein